MRFFKVSAIAACSAILCRGCLSIHTCSGICPRFS